MCYIYRKSRYLRFAGNAEEMAGKAALRMRRMLGAALCCLLCVCLPLLAQADHMAVVNGEVYCITGENLRGEAAIHRITPDGLETVFVCSGRAQELYEMNGRLLLMTAEAEEQVPALLKYDETCPVYRSVDPATGEATLLTDLTGWGIFSRGGELLRRHVGSGVGEPILREERLAGDGWVTTFAWEGDFGEDPMLVKSDGDWLLLKTRSTGYRRIEARIYDIAAGTEYTVHDYELYARARLEDGVLYCVGAQSLYAIDLATGQRKQLMTLASEYAYFVSMDEARFVLYQQGCLEIRDRATLALLHRIEMPDPSYYVQSGGMLYLLNPTTSYSGRDVRPAFCAVIDLETGESWVTMLH